MKRKNNLYESLLTYDKIYDAFKIVSKNYNDKNRIMNFSFSLNTNLLYILNLLKENKYQFGKYNIFLIKRPKYRIVMSQNISDKIVNHLLSKFILIPYLDKSLIDTTVATRKNKGSKKAFDMFLRYIKTQGKNKKIYALKIDIKKYFYNIDHEILLNKIERKIKDIKILNFIKVILNSTNDEYINKKINELKTKEILKIKNSNNSDKNERIKSIEYIPIYLKGKGIPIGNMYSQIFANLYLSKIDHFIKEELKQKYYIRYMDDLVIINENKEELKAILPIIENLINKESLEINKKSKIYLVNEGIPFLGYTFSIFNNNIIIKYNKQTLKRIKKRLKKLWKDNFNLYFKSVYSYKGYFQNSNTKYKLNFFCERSNSMYEKYLELKNKYKDQMIFIKSGKFYSTFDDDAVIINYLSGYKLLENRVGFPINCMFKIKSLLSSKNIGFCILEGNEVINSTIENNNYSDVFSKSLENYNKQIKIDNLIKELIQKLNNDFSLYEKIKETLN